MEGASIATKDGWEKTALHWAVERRHEAVVALLLDRGNPDLIAATDRSGQTALHGAAYHGHKDMVALLLDKNPDLAAAKDGWEKDGLTLGGGERAQGRGRAA